MQGDLLRFALISLIVFVPLFNAQKHVLTHFGRLLLVDYPHLIIIVSACL